MKVIAPRKLVVLLFLLATTSLIATADTFNLVTTQSGVGANDFATWGQLGPDGTVVAFATPATTSGGKSLFVDPFGGNALVAVQCPASPSCSWTGGFTPGESLIWAFDSTSNVGSGPLGFRVGAVTALGAWIQSDVPGQFTVSLNVYDLALNLAANFSVTSDTAGDPIFVGVLDQTRAGIGAVKFDTADHDFAAGTLYLQYPGAPTVPEPGTIALLGGGLIGAGFRLRRRYSQR